MKGKGQSAIEFLMTYGWAVLIMLVVIAILFMVGVFNPGTAVPESCVLPAGFTCYSYSIDSTGKLYLDMGQAKGKRITITALTCSMEEDPSLQSITPVTIDNGRHRIVVNGTQCLDEDGQPFTGGEAFRGRIVFTYNEFGVGVPHTVHGDISGPMGEGSGGGGGGGGGGSTPTPTPGGSATPTPTGTATPTPTATATPPQIDCPIRITDTIGEYYWPDIGGDIIAWTTASGNWNVYVYDISAGETVAVPGTLLKWTPRVDAGRVIFNTNGTMCPNCPQQVHLYDTSTGTVTPVSTPTANGHQHIGPSLSGDHAVWYDTSAGLGNEEIWMYTFSSGTETQISNMAGNDDDPDVSGDYVVWLNNYLYTYRISTSTKTQRTFGEEGPRSPRMDGNYIVFEDYGYGDWSSHISLYNIGTSSKTRVSNDPGDDGAYAPDVSGSRIVWEDWRDGDDSEIFMYDVSSGTETRITDDTFDEYSPRVSGNRIIWVDKRNGGRDIYMWDFDLCGYPDT